MRSSLALTITLLAAVPLSAQTWVQVTAGGTYSSPIVDDGVLNIRLRPALAPTLGAALSRSTGKGGYRAVLALDYSRSPLKTSGDGGPDQLFTVAAMEVTGMVEVPIHGAIRARFGGGAIWYSPARDEGVFLSGGTRRWIVAAELLWSRRLADRLDLLVAVRGTFHEFITGTLRDRGYAGNQGVQRLGVRLGVERRL